MNFTEYLQAKNYSVATIATYNKYITPFLQWLAAESIPPASFTYNDLVDFMRHCDASGKTQRTVSGMLGVIRHYCNYQVSENKRTDNPASGLFIRGRGRKLPSGLLEMEELESLFEQYRVQLHVALRKKILLGLLIWQGMTTGELSRLKIKDLWLEKGKILVRGTKRTNERLLPLQAVQLTDLQDYLKQNRSREERLFTDGKNLQNIMQYMFEQLKKINVRVVNAKQIRSSVITHWLKHHSLRQVQYMAGHKYVSSTERYQLTMLDDLQQSLRQHHPMNQVSGSTPGLSCW